ncbi:NAD(P)H-binding protein [Tabrizicola sp. YIM 78059]|uniref:NAD(P)H-binding protein n=1 Tax=Tabrizicola sp. YIM 78059 TaxID=2529861 RepID=UPI0010AA5DDB|nr:NAD(P)H-binding protein [Tabrizicola sp. YIM 78059]
MGKADGQRDVFLLGGTGTIGRATARALLNAGFEVTTLVRQGADAAALAGCRLIEGSATDLQAVRDAMRIVRPAAVVSCLASRTGEPRDAWAVDHAAHSAALRAALAEGVRQFVLLSAICVQKPLLEFQHAKLAFEAELQAAPIDWSIIRPTAYFKSLSGQVPRVKAGRAFVVFGDGRLTACKPISDSDLGRYLALCLTDPAKRNRILPVGGPGPALTPLDQAAILERLLDRPVRIRHVPVAMMDWIIRGLSFAGLVAPKLRAKAQLARIGRYYATESMLVWDGARYDAEATPEFGVDRLEDHYAAMLRGEVADDRGAHAVF